MSGYRYTGGFWRRRCPAGENPINQDPLDNWRFHLLLILRAQTSHTAGNSIEVFSSHHLGTLSDVPIYVINETIRPSTLRRAGHSNCNMWDWKHKNKSDGQRWFLSRGFHPVRILRFGLIKFICPIRAYCPFPTRDAQRQISFLSADNEQNSVWSRAESSDLFGFLHKIFTCGDKPGAFHSLPDATINQSPEIIQAIVPRI